MAVRDVGRKRYVISAPFFWTVRYADRRTVSRGCHSLEAVTAERAQRLALREDEEKVLDGKDVFGDCVGVEQAGYP